MSYDQKRFFQLTRDRLRDVIDQMKARKANVRTVRDWLPDGTPFLHLVAFGESAMAVQSMIDRVGEVKGEDAAVGSMQRPAEAGQPFMSSDVALDIVGVRHMLLDAIHVSGDVEGAAKAAADKLFEIVGGSPEVAKMTDDALKAAHVAAGNVRDHGVAAAVTSSVGVQVIEGDG